MVVALFFDGPCIQALFFCKHEHLSRLFHPVSRCQQAARALCCITVLSRLHLLSFPAALPPLLLRHRGRERTASCHSMPTVCAAQIHCKLEYPNSLPVWRPCSTVGRRVLDTSIQQMLRESFSETFSSSTMLFSTACVHHLKVCSRCRRGCLNDGFCMT